jgi:hypothetical protein
MYIISRLRVDETIGDRQVSFDDHLLNWIFAFIKLTFRKTKEVQYDSTSATYELQLLVIN